MLLSFKIILVFIFIQVQVTVGVGNLKEMSLLVPQVKSTCNVINWVQNIVIAKEKKKKKIVTQNLGDARRHDEGFLYIN